MEYNPTIWRKIDNMVINKSLLLLRLPCYQFLSLSFSFFLSFFLSFSLSLYIYIYWQNFFIDTYLIEHNRHFLSTYFFLNPFELPYRSYDIQQELVDKPFIISYFSSIFCPTLGHH